MLGQKGQTAIEYLLMIVVAVGLGYTFQRKMSEYFIKNPNGPINSALREYRNLFSGGDPRRPYRTFKVNKRR